MNMTIIWLVAFVVLVAIELCTMALTTIWFAGGALGATLVAVLGGQLWLQIIVFLVLSSVLLFFTRPIALKYFNKGRVRTNAEGLIGKQAIITAQVNNLKGEGKATVDGNEWSARAESEDRVIEPGTVVTIKAIKGVKLIVS